MSDDEEEMGAPSSDDSSCSADEKYDSDLSDWDIWKTVSLYLEERMMTNLVSNLQKYLTPLMAYIGSLEYTY
jgi:hypothetical protein